MHPAARVSPDACPAEGCVVGAGAALDPNVVVGDWAVIGPGTVLGAGAVVGPGVRVGARCVVHSGARLGFSNRPTAPGQAGLSKAASFNVVVVGTRSRSGRTR